MKKKELSEIELMKLFNSLSDKVNTISSSDGYASLDFSGVGEYKKLKINVDLSLVDKQTLEKDICDIFNYAKNQVTIDLNNMLQNDPEEEEQEDDEDGGVRYVS